MTTPLTDAEIARIRQLLGEAPPSVGLQTLTPNVVPGELITSQWGNEIRDRTLQVFESAAARAAEWPNPPIGAQSVLLDSNARSINIWDGTQWRPPFGTVVLEQMHYLSDPSSGALGIRDIQTFYQGASYPFATIIQIIGGLLGGFSAGDSNFAYDIQDLQRGSVYGQGFHVWAKAGTWTAYPCSITFSNPPGQTYAFKVRQNVSANGGGAVHCGGQISVTIYAT